MRRVGYINLGPDAVAFHVDPGSGHGAMSLHDKAITVGLGHDLWEECLAVLMHEAVEYAAAQAGVRWMPAPGYGGGGDSYLFVLTHPAFTEVVGRAAMFCSAALPPLAEAYAASKRPPRKKAKKGAKK